MPTPHAAQVDDPVAVRLIGGRWAWIGGRLWLALGAAVMAAIGAGVTTLFTIETAGPQTLASVGVILAAPGLAALAVLSDIGWRHLRPRRGVIEILDDRIVVHDRWLLRRPVEIYRSEIREIRRLPVCPTGSTRRLPDAPDANSANVEHSST